MKNIIFKMISITIGLIFLSNCTKDAQSEITDLNNSKNPVIQQVDGWPDRVTKRFQDFGYRWGCFKTDTPNCWDEVVITPTDSPQIANIITLILDDNDVPTILSENFNLLSNYLSEDILTQTINGDLTLSIIQETDPDVTFFIFKNDLGETVIVYPLYN